MHFMFKEIDADGQPVPDPDGQFAYYKVEAPCELVLPNSSPRVYQVITIGEGNVVPWRGLAGDRVDWPAGTVFSPVATGDDDPEAYAFKCEYTVGADGFNTALKVR